MYLWNQFMYPSVHRFDIISYDIQASRVSVVVASGSANLLRIFQAAAAANIAGEGYVWFTLEASDFVTGIIYFCVLLIMCIYRTLMRTLKLVRILIRILPVAGLLADVPPCSHSNCIHDLALNETEVKSSSFVSPCMCVSISERGRRDVGVGSSE